MTSHKSWTFNGSRMIPTDNPELRADKAAHDKLCERIRQAFSPEALIRICEMDEDEFSTVATEWVQREMLPPNNRYFYLDRGPKVRVLGIAHLDTVCQNRQTQVTTTAAGPLVTSGALDDRLGAWVILDLLPKLGVKCDVLLTTGEESGQSTAELFTRHPDRKEYNWIFSFDRGGTDVVMYNYTDHATSGLVRDVGAIVGEGSFSDICWLESLGVKGFNWGVGYQDYHGPRGHAWLNDTFNMVAKFVRFHGRHQNTRLAHTTARDADTPINQTEALLIREGLCPRCTGDLDSLDYCPPCRIAWASSGEAPTGMAIDDETGRILDLLSEDAI